MRARPLVVLAVMVVCLCGAVLAQDEGFPLSNWSAPPYWSPAVQPRAEGGAVGGMVAHAQGMGAQAEALPSSPLPFVAIAPCRIVDTRVNNPDGFHSPNFADDESRSFPFPTSSDCTGLPATAGAWSLNIQFRPISQLSYLTAYPTGTTMPLVSTMTAGPAAWVQNAAIVPAGTDGAIDIYCQYAGRVIIDINGYYPLFLPFSGSASSAAGTDIFTIQNTGMGRAMHAIAAGDAALLAESDWGTGVKGTASSGIGGSFTGYHGVEAYGLEYGGYFKDSTPGETGWAKLGFGNVGGSFSGSYAGVQGAGDIASSGIGGSFSGWFGVIAYGNGGGDAVIGSAYGTGRGVRGISVLGTGGYFSGGITGIVATGGSGTGGGFDGFHGVEAYGLQYGGYFKDNDNSGYAYIAAGDYGVQGFGTKTGAYFEDTDSSGRAYIGYGDRGIEASGYEAGGYFKDLDHSGYAYLGYGDYGIQAYGNARGGDFSSNSDGGNGIRATASVAQSGIGGYFSGWTGVFAYGNGLGNGVYARAQGIGYGIYATAASGTAGYFSGNNGLEAYGNRFGFGVRGSNAATGTYADLGKDTYKVYGTGSVSFVQNHPYDPGAVVVYSAPEGDEVATYTRGTARLVNGQARVSLGETFAWVTNPDLGLTAYVTPRGEPVALAVVSLTADELVVRAPEGTPDGLAFDFIVYGLRIGFEESAVVQEKHQEAPIPSMRNHLDLFARRPDLGRYTAFARFGAGREALGITEPLRLERANTLKAAIHEFDPAVDRIERAGPSSEPSRTAPPNQGPTSQGVAQGPPAVRRQDLPDRTAVGDGSPGVGLFASEQDVHARSFSSPREQLATRVAIAGTVEPGDVLVVDRAQSERFTRGDRAADPTVVGVVVAEAGVALGVPQAGGASAAVALSGIARCKVDASFGAIAPGDLLVSSPTPGHAMRDNAPLAGTVVGKALEPLVAGQGVIRVLVMLR